MTATLAATSVSHLTTRTCTGPDGSYQFTDAHYTGTVTSSDSRLGGRPIKIHAQTVYNTTKNLGTVEGDPKIDTTSAGQIKAKLVAVDSNGTLGGSVDGHAGGGTNLVGTLSGTGFNPATGFASGSIGTGGPDPASSRRRSQCPIGPRTCVPTERGSS